MKRYGKVMAAVIACMLIGGECVAANATVPATESMGWFKKTKKKQEKEEKVKTDYEKLVEGSEAKKGMFTIYQEKGDYYFEIPTSL